MNGRREMNEFKKKHYKLAIALRPVHRFVHNILNPGDMERKRNFGDKNKDKTIYVIRIKNRNAGMFSIINTILTHLDYADRKGFYPYIDMQNYKNIYLTEEKLHKENAWEYYFNQPDCKMTPITIDDVYMSKKVILSNTSSFVHGKEITAELCYQYESKDYLRYRNIYQKYIMLNDVLKEKLNSLTDELFSDKRILGVLCRGTDYVCNKPFRHPIQPSISVSVEFVKRKLMEWKCDFVYLSTEDQEILSEYQRQFGDRLIYLKRKYIELNPQNEHDDIADLTRRVMPPREAGEIYLLQISLLTRCTSVILGNTSAALSIVFANSYENIFIWKLGLYGIDDIEPNNV